MKWFQTLCSENVPTYEPLLNKTACDFDKELKSYGLQASEG